MRRLPLPSDIEGLYKSGMDAFCPAPTPRRPNPRRPKIVPTLPNVRVAEKISLETLFCGQNFRVGLLTHLHKITWKLCSEALK
jgi:hypothetical protein